MSKPLDLGLQNSLAVFYLLAALMNVGFALYYFRRKDVLKAVVWAAVAGLFVLHAGAYFAHLGWKIPPAVTDGIDALMGPVTYTSLSVLLFVVMLYFRKF